MKSTFPAFWKKWMISSDWGMLRAKEAGWNGLKQYRSTFIRTFSVAFHGKMVERERRGVIFIAKINFIAVLTNPFPPWNHTQIKKNDWECSSSLWFFCTHLCFQQRSARSGLRTAQFLCPSYSMENRYIKNKESD